jgi:hypothetical protein
MVRFEFRNAFGCLDLENNVNNRLSLIQRSILLLPRREFAICAG